MVFIFGTTQLDTRKPEPLKDSKHHAMDKILMPQKLSLFNEHDQVVVMHRSGCDAPNNSCQSRS